MPEVRILLKDIEDPNSHTLEFYEKRGGYEALKKVIQEKWDPKRIIEEVKISNLRGRGGAGFPTGVKWGFVPVDSPLPKYIVCNADEGEPGTFKDKLLLRKTPHQIIEGMVLAGYALSSHLGFIYFRYEFYEEMEIMEKAIEEAKKKNYLGENILGSSFSFDIVLYRGAGAYICGEETALLSSLEGKRGHPRLRPPFPAVKGLYDSPTVVNNVETFAAVPHIVRNGGKWYAELGVEKSGGTKLYSISGHIARPGVYEVPLGTPLKEIIYDIAGGIPGGKKLKAVIPGGSSTPILTAEEVEEARMDYESLMKYKTFLGSGGIIVFDETTSMPHIAYRSASFYAHESCGQCTPCREGTKWLADILKRLLEGKGTKEDLDTLFSFTEYMANGATICALSDAAVMGVVPIIRKFWDEFEALVYKKGVA